MQTLATLLGPIRCKRLHIMLCVVSTCWKFWMKFETGQTSEPTSAIISIVSRSSKRGPTMLRLFAQHIQQCCACARALHATYPHKYMQTRNQHGVGDGKRPRVLCILIWRPNLLWLVASVCIHRATRDNIVACCCERLHWPSFVHRSLSQSIDPSCNRDATHCSDFAWFGPLIKKKTGSSFYSQEIYGGHLVRPLRCETSVCKSTEIPARIFY